MVKRVYRIYPKDYDKKLIQGILLKGYARVGHARIAQEKEDNKIPIEDRK